MPTELILQTAPEALELSQLRQELADARALLAERELDVAYLRAELAAFEGLYMRQVGVLYAELDELEARIAEHELRLYDSAEARDRATEARRRAQETHEAAYGEAATAQPFDPSPNLKRLFREVAKRIHPDFARDAEEQEHFTRLMAHANKAYTRSDAEALQRILDDHAETVETTGEEDDAAEVLRLRRQLAHAQRDIAAIEAELAALPAGEIAQLRNDVQAARLEERDLLAELAAGLREKVADAQHRFEFLQRNLFAQGR